MANHMMMSERAAVLTREAYLMGLSPDSATDMLYRNGHIVSRNLVIDLYVAMDEEGDFYEKTKTM